MTFKEAWHRWRQQGKGFAADDVQITIWFLAFLAGKSLINFIFNKLLGHAWDHTLNWWKKGVDNRK